jgi:hypothetical protein
MPLKKRQSKTLYEKRGGKFVPVGKDDFILPYGVGDYLVRVRKGHRSIHWCKKKLDVDHAKLEIVLVEAADALARSIMKNSEAEPKVRPWTEKEQKAWAAYKRIAGHESLTLSMKSAQEVAMLSVIVLRDNLRHPDAKDRPDGCIDVFAEKEITGP